MDAIKHRKLMRLKIVSEMDAIFHGKNSIKINLYKKIEVERILRQKTRPRNNNNKFHVKKFVPQKVASKKLCQKISCRKVRARKNASKKLF